MAFELEKILTISASEYCETKGSTVGHYTMKGVCGEHKNLEVPEETEVVVGYRLIRTEADSLYGVGTALICKK